MVLRNPDNGRPFHHVYQSSVHDWAVCQIADNSSFKKLIAALMEIPHVGCANHRLYLEVRKMIKSDTSLSWTIDTVHDVMRSANKSCATVLSSGISQLFPLFWITKPVIERFNDIGEALIEVADSDDSELVIDRRVSFKKKTVQYAKQLGEINVVTPELQKHGCTLSHCRWALDV